MLRRKAAPVAFDPQEAADAAAWRLLTRRRPEIAERIRLALVAGRPPEQVIAVAAEGWPRLSVLLPCAVHGCARGLMLQASRPTPGRLAAR